MVQNEKPQPSANVPQPSLKERVSRGIDDETGRRSLQVKLKVRGGLPSQKYAFDFAAGGDGAATCQVEDQLRKRAGASGTKRSTLSDKEFVSLLKKVQPALDSPVEPPSFLPDTVIGILEISDGTATRRIYFAADPEQARTQGKVPPREVLEAADAVYAAGASLLGARNIKP
jgi:hypothetical protein